MKKQVVITSAISKAIQRTPYRSTDGQGGKAKVIAKLFYPRGNNAFLIVEGGHNEGETWDGDIVYGWCKHDGGEFEAGTFSLRELLNTKAKIEWSFGTCELGIERDICVDVKKQTVLEVMGSEAPAWLKEKAEAPENEPEPDTTTAEDVEAAGLPVPDAVIDATAEEPVVAPVEPDNGPSIVIVDPEPEAVEPVPEKKPRKSRKAAKVEKVEPEVVAVQPIPGAWEPEAWKKLTADNFHNEVRMAISNWATANATAESEEFCLLAQDYAFITSEGAANMTPDLLDFRGELDDELKERVTRVYGEAKWAEVNACL